MYITEQVAGERTRDTLKQAEHLRYVRAARMLSRAHRTEHRAERRLAQATRHAAALRTALEAAGH